MTAETFQPNFGAFGLGAVVAFVFGSIILIDTDMLPALLLHPLSFLSWRLTWFLKRGVTPLFMGRKK